MTAGVCPYKHDCIPVWWVYHLERDVNSRSEHLQCKFWPTTPTPLLTHTHTHPLEWRNNPYTRRHRRAQRESAAAFTRPHNSAMWVYCLVVGTTRACATPLPSGFFGQTCMCVSAAGHAARERTIRGTTHVRVCRRVCVYMSPHIGAHAICLSRHGPGALTWRERADRSRCNQYSNQKPRAHARLVCASSMALACRLYVCLHGWCVCVRARWRCCVRVLVNVRSPNRCGVLKV